MRRLLALVLLIVMTAFGGLMAPAPALAAPVSWVEVTPTDAGRQWWDEGSLRISKNGTLSVLSRFQPAPAAAAAAGDTEGQGSSAPRPKILGDLYVMEIDCGQGLYRDTSVNGLPRWGAEWEPVGGDGLIEAVVAGSCAAAGLAQQPVPS